MAFRRSDTKTQVDRAREGALPLTGSASFDPLLERIGDARYVLLGEASHGSTDYYRWRAVLTRRLIEEKGFSFIAVEGDWPDCQAVHRSVTAAPGAPDDPFDALMEFDRWPTWMWANTNVLRFARWLREHNVGLAPGSSHVGFFGLDVYSLWESLDAVIGYLDEHAPAELAGALEAYRCFEPYAEEPRSYAHATRFAPSGCEREVLALLVRLRQSTEYAETAGGSFAQFAARQNAEVLAGAERYYRAMVGGGPQSWNIRDHHMADTLDRLMEHHGPDAKAVVWAHNTHVGDARATDMPAAGVVSLGQIVRERHATEGVVLVGFGSYDGTVVAAGHWGDAPSMMCVPPARTDSVEELLHRAFPGSAGLFVFPEGVHYGVPAGHSPDWFDEERDHRAIGVVYRPDAEKRGNYVPTVLGERYDAFVFLDRSQALAPLHGALLGTGEEETWPTGM
ncbi:MULTISPECIES: erythromycin esterase family protein [unclassified Streptomyces]|uniref:erythromycin esterase family protein n=1 Tax=unclassified Streptomyces TaxID=2593676 RepID=UPI002E0DB0AA|nr:erythromycin esterase family protein [Streptomyces sp. NBC_01197]WSS47668.1 erythromycin esterase family protein [Streptomyces sp. NBC_01180]